MRSATMMRIIYGTAAVICFGANLALGSYWGYTLSSFPEHAGALVLGAALGVSTVWILHRHNQLLGRLKAPMFMATIMTMMFGSAFVDVLAATAILLGALCTLGALGVDLLATEATSPATKAA